MIHVPRLGSDLYMRVLTHDCSCINFFALINQSIQMKWFCTLNTLIRAIHVFEGMKARFYSVNIFPKYTWCIPELSMGRVYSWYIPGIYQEKIIWGFHMPNIGFLPDIRSPTAPISGHVSRYWGFLLTRYRDKSHVTRYLYRVHTRYRSSCHWYRKPHTWYRDQYRVQYRVSRYRWHDIPISVSISGTNIGCPDIWV